MNQSEMFGAAKWVAPSEICANPYIRKSFFAEEIEKAVITVCGLGFYKFFINGKNGTDDMFVTLYTDYNEHHMRNGAKLGHRLICQQYDITDKIVDGENVIGFLLGQGYYHCDPPSLPYALFPVYGDVKLCFAIEITETDGTVNHIYSDVDMKWQRSFITECEAFVRGEIHNYTFEQPGWDKAEFDDTCWMKTVMAETPDTDFIFSDCPTDRIIRNIIPKVINETDEYTVYDLGENVTGIPVFLSNGFIGRADFEFSESMLNGKPCPWHNMKQYFKAFLNGEKRYLKPELTWIGCRYVLAPKGTALTEFQVVHSDVKVTSSFSSSDSTLNWLFDAYIRTQLNNMHVGVPMDCPTEERAGYTGDGQLCCEAAMTMLDAEKFYRKWIDDISDCQDRNTGRVDYTAPYVGRGGGPGGWGSAIVEVPYVYYKMYGDTELLKKMYPQMLMYVDYMAAHSENGLVTSDEPGRWCLGDWCTSEPIAIPEPFVNTYFLVKAINRILEISEVIGETDTAGLEKIGKTAKKALTREYFDCETGDFCGTLQKRLASVCGETTLSTLKREYLDKSRSFCGTYQATNAFALDIGLGNIKTLKNLVSYYSEYGMFDSGIFGTDILLRVLFENGYGELAFKLMAGEGKYSFGAWKNKGATTLHEYWLDGRSYNHPMFGAGTRYLFQYILGIRQMKNTCCWKDIIISPAGITLSEAHGVVETPNGKIGIEISRDKTKERFAIILPENINARFVYRDTDVTLRPGKNEIICKSFLNENS